MSIRTYVLIILVGLLGWQVLLFAATFYYVEHEDALRQAKERQVDTMDKLRAVCQESAMRTSPFAAINFVNILTRDPVVSHALCADFNGRILAHTDPERIGEYLPRESAALTAMESGTVLHEGQAVILEAYSPVMVQARRAGVISVGFNEDVIGERISSSLWDVLARVLMVSALTLVVGLLSALLVAHRLTGPLMELVKGAKAIAAGDLGYTVPVEGGRSNELRFLTEEFNRMALRLKEVEAVKERFLASVTHDLRAPLVGIQGHTELLMNQDLTEEQARHLESIYDSSRILSQHINDILDLNRLGAGRMEIKRVSVDLPSVIDSVCEIMSAKSQEYGVRLESVISPDLPAVLADQRLLHRVLSNLVSNALKFTPEGGRVAVAALTVLSLDASGLAVPVAARVEVRDTGPGIPPERLEAVFDAFFQVDETRRQARSEGTGLGLAIAKEIIQAHGGRIWAESRLGEGAIIQFTLPLASTPGDAAAEVPAGKSPTVGPPER